MVIGTSSEITTPRSFWEHWDGYEWNLVPGMNPGLQSNESYGVAASASDDVWAVGTYDNIGGECPQPALIEHWNGSEWSLVPSQDPLACNNLYGVAAIAPDDVWAVGESSNESQSANLVEHWDGFRGPSAPKVSKGGAIFDAVSADASNDVWMVGRLIERWDGSRCDQMGTVPVDVQDSGITAIAPGDVWLVGTRYPPGHRSRTFTEHWDGTSWTIIASPNRGHHVSNGLSDVTALAPDSVWAVGASSADGAPAKTLTMRWNGATWSIVKSPNPPATYGDGFAAVSGLPNTKLLWAVGGTGLDVGRIDTLIERHGLVPQLGPRGRQEDLPSG